MARKQKTPVITEGQIEIAQFSGKEVRKVLHEDEWYFSVLDVIEAVMDEPEPESYWGSLKSELVERGYDDLFEVIVKLQMPDSQGIARTTEAANTETIFYLIQAIPSKKASRFKRWLAKVGYERILEFQNPEIAIKRAILDYKMKGYNDEWIDTRVRSILVRNELVGEWSRRGVREGKEYATLTNIIQEATFGLDVNNHKAFKQLKKSHSLRDHMTDMELIFTMLGEKSTRDIAVASDARGFNPNKVAASDGGKVAGDARIALEVKTGKRVVSDRNFLPKGGDQGKLTS